MYYTMNFANQTQVNVTAINCDEYISKYLPDLNSKQKESIMSEMFDKPEVYKCPDTDSISLTQSNDGFQKFAFQVGLSSEAKEQYTSGNET